VVDQCILTGVKEFRYKDTEEFALFVTVDDGSLATEALIHHEVRNALMSYF
jgi:hypothetical protein